MINLFGYAKMLETGVLSPVRPRKHRLKKEQAEYQLRKVALLRSLTTDEAEALLRTGETPSRLGGIADFLGFSLEEAEQILRHLSWFLTEGVRIRIVQRTTTDSSESSHQPEEDS